MWKRISELFPDYDLFPTELHCDNFQQEEIGDCYFVDMISLISNYGELLTRLFPIEKNDHGYYEVILFINGWKRVILDDYIPILRYGQINQKLLGCSSKKYQKCFYFMLLEKAWAKVNKNYYNIYGGSSNDSLLVLTGFDGEKILINNSPNEDRKNQILKDMENGIRKNGHLFGVNDYGHAYSLLDIETFLVNNINYKVLKVRNPWGETGTHFLDSLNNNINEDLRTRFRNRRDIVEDELVPRLEQYNNTIDNGIFFISKNYFFQLFRSYSINYHMFDSSVIEFLLKCNIKDINKRFFTFKLIVEENSLIQINLTKHYFNKEGRMIFGYHQTKIKIKPSINENNNNEIDGPTIKKIPPGAYFIEWNYENFDPPEEILFWICYQGKIKLDFVGNNERSQINFNYFIFNSNEGLTIKKNSYKLSEKLGEKYRRQVKIFEFVENTLHCNINGDEEDRGYSITYQENDNIAFSFIMSKEDIKKTRVLSQNLDFPDYIFEGNNSRYRRIIGEGNIYLDNNIVYHGQMNYNLFPQRIHENDPNRLIIDVEAKRFKLSQEIIEDELIRINARRYGPFEGQRTLITHPHALTKCITPIRQGWKCDHCDTSFCNKKYSFYCTLCDFDFCDDNCRRPNTACRQMTPHQTSRFHFKSLLHKHSLVKIKIANRNNHLKCFSCLKDIQPEKRFYYCTKCDFRLCEKCQITESRGKHWQFITSWHEHPLSFCITKGYKKGEVRTNSDKVEILEDNEFYFTCNHCGIEYSRKKDTFYCTACDFYVCMKCYKNYFFYIEREINNAVNINKGNCEVYPVKCRCFLNNDNEAQTVNCNKCNTQLNLADWTYYCSNCNSNFCNICYRSHKVIFQNNILIFDGNFVNNIKNGFGITYKENNEINYSGNWENGIFKLMKNINHGSHPLIRNSFNENIQCDICYKLCDSYDCGLSCSQSNLNICDNCIIKINTKLIKPIFNVYEVIIKRKPKEYKCDYCKKNLLGIFFIFKIKNKIFKNCCLECFENRFNK